MQKDVEIETITGTFFHGRLVLVMEDGLKVKVTNWSYKIIPLHAIITVEGHENEK
jgi:hypothetical protein